MSLVSDIENIVNTLYPLSTFVLSSRFKASRNSFDLNKTSYPLIVLDNEITKTASIQKNNNLLKDSQILLSVLDKKPKEEFETDVIINEIQAVAEIMADKIMVNIYQLDAIRLSGGSNQTYKITPLFNEYITNLCGVVIDASVKYNSTISFCKNQQT